MTFRFDDRQMLLDESACEFLRKLAYLGGYSTADQAQKMGLANSPRRVLVRLRDLERSRFLRQVVQHPLVYQITKSVTRLVGTDMWARRPHALATLERRLLGVNFYLEATSWPATFIFGHKAKIEALTRLGCPQQVLPKHGGQPYLWEDFVLDAHDGGLCVSVVDRVHCSALLQALGFVRRFAPCRSRVGENLSLIVAVDSHARQRLYAKAVTHPKVQKYAHGFVEAVAAYQVTTPLPHIGALTHESDAHSDNWIRGGYEET
jgi:hypothetical protein